MLCYCKKCGRIIFNILDESDKKCDCCGAVVYPIPNEYKGSGSYKTYQKDLWEKYVKVSPEFDQYLFDHRDEILAKQSAEFNAKMAHGKAVLEEASRTPKCPTCQSTNIRKMSGVERGASIATFGLFSKKINKTFKCNNCGYTW